MYKYVHTSVRWFKLYFVAVWAEVQFITNQENEIIHVTPPTTDRRTYRFFIYMGFVGIIASIVITGFQLMLLPQYVESLIAEDAQGVLSIGALFNQTYTWNFEISLSIALGFFGYLSKNGSKLGIVFVLLSIEPVLLIIYQIIESSYLSFLHETPNSPFSITLITLIITKLILAFILLKTHQTTSNKFLLAIVAILFIISPIFTNLWNYLTMGFQTSVVIMLELYYEYTISYFPNILFYLPIFIFPILIAFVAALLFISELRNDE